MSLLSLQSDFKRVNVAYSSLIDLFGEIRWSGFDDYERLHLLRAINALGGVLGKDVLHDRVKKEASQ